MNEHVLGDHNGHVVPPRLNQVSRRSDVVPLLAVFNKRTKIERLHVAQTFSHLQVLVVGFLASENDHALLKGDGGVPQPPMVRRVALGIHALPRVAFYQLIVRRLITQTSFIAFEPTPAYM